MATENKWKVYDQTEENDIWLRAHWSELSHEQKIHARDGWTPKKPEEWTDAECLKIPPESMFKQWNRYDKERYYEYKRRKAKGKSPKKEDIKSLGEELQKLNLSADWKGWEHFNNLQASLSTTSGQKQSLFEKITGMKESECDGGIIPLAVALFKGPNGERMDFNENLAKFIGRVGENISQHRTIAATKTLVEDYNKESESKFTITLNEMQKTLSLVAKQKVA